jgi:Tfp pilus assembly protein PilN
MMNHNRRPVRINLASSPLRNRRPFWFLLGLLAVLTLALAGAGLSAFLRYHGPNAETAAAVRALRLRTDTDRTETTALLARTQDLSRKLKSGVDFANEAIFLKSLSWTRFLSELEASLPARSSIVALSPTPMGQARVEVRMRAVFSSLDSMLAFINNLRSRSFSDIRLLSDERKAGQIVSEVTVSYADHR